MRNQKNSHAQRNETAATTKNPTNTHMQRVDSDSKIQN